MVYSENDVGDAHPRIHGAVPLGVPLALAALLFEDANLRPARLTVDDGDDARVGDKGRADDNFAAILFHQEHVLHRELIPTRAYGSVYRHEPARHDPALMAAVLDDGIHNPTSLAL